MVDFYYKEINDWFENNTIQLLNHLFNNQIIFQRNNLKNNDLDLIGHYNEENKNNIISKKYDVQYSFIQNNKFYFDFISAAKSLNNKNSIDLNKEIGQIENFNLEELIFLLKNEIEIQKDGKWFNNELNGVFYYLYFDLKKPNHHNFTKEKLKQLPKPCFCFISKKDFEYIFKNHFKELKIKFNNKEKYGINEKHLSAFIEIDFEKLKNILGLKIYSDRQSLLNDLSFKENILNDFLKDNKFDINNHNKKLFSI